MDGKSTIDARRIAVLAGGHSAERDISLASGQHASAALSLASYEAVLIDPAQIELRAVEWQTFDACFVALHGGEGEDGRVQAALEQFQIPYTGSGPESSRLAMSKQAAKEVFRRFNVPTLPFAVLGNPRCRNAVSNELLRLSAEALSFPLIVKPESQGSSLGVSVARDWDEFRQSARMAREFDDRVLIEPFIEGREFTISLLAQICSRCLKLLARKKYFHMRRSIRTEELNID